MRKCENCSSDFEIIMNGSGGHNRKYCYKCYPDGLTKSERGEVRANLLRKKSEDYKVKIGCKLCGYNKSSWALEWHHPEDNKDDLPSNLIKRSWKAYIEETKKCTLLCANCHREVHSGLVTLDDL